MKRIATLFIIILLCITPVSACASAISADGFGFRRDAPDSANITISNVDNVYTESKPGFVHTIYYSDGWAFGIGGKDSIKVNNLMVKIGELSHQYKNPYIALASIPLLLYLGIGHIAIKYPGGAFYVAYSDWNLRFDNVALDNNTILVVTNDPNYITTYTSTDVFSALSSNKFAAEHQRYIIGYNNSGFKVQYLNNATDPITSILI